jgi:hypothetical protein
MFFLVTELSSFSNVLCRIWCTCMNLSVHNIFLLILKYIGCLSLLPFTILRVFSWSRHFSRSRHPEMKLGNSITWTKYWFRSYRLLRLTYIYTERLLHLNSSILLDPYHCKSLSCLCPQLEVTLARVTWDPRAEFLVCGYMFALRCKYSIGQEFYSWNLQHCMLPILINELVQL